MILKIKDIKNIDAFDLFQWSALDFQKYNLIYGWNGSGKTTLSRILSFLEKKIIDLPEYNSLDFTIHSDAGLIKTQDLKTHGLNVRVFNEEFVKENLQFSDSKAKRIIIIGKENLELQKEIDEIEDKRKRSQEELNKQTAKLPRSPTYEKILTTAAGEVPKQFGNTPLANDAYYGRSYRKNKVDDLLAQGTIGENNLETLIITDENILAENKEIIKNEKAAIPNVISKIEGLKSLYKDTNALLGLDLEIEDIEELSEDKGLRDWVEAGYRIHKERSLSVCQFCNNPIPKGMLEKLGRYFTKELLEFRKKIDDNIECLNKYENENRSIDIDSRSFFPDISKGFLKSRSALHQCAESIKKSISEIIAALKKKKDSIQINDSSSIIINYPDEDVNIFNECADEINKLIANHNKRVDKNIDEIMIAAKKIELHTIAVNLKQGDYFTKKKEYLELEANIKQLRDNCDKLSLDANNKRSAMRNTALAVDKINTIAKEYFGEGQIYLEVAESTDSANGYVLKRRRKKAKHLSEGEKSILALIYFFVKLEEEGCDKTACTIVIDDPIDSQDAMHLFQTFGLFKDKLKNAKQLIVFTHNYEFFNLVRDWMNRPNEKSSLYLMSIHRDQNIYKLTVEDLPLLLKEYKSEYQYLFSRLYLYKNDHQIIDEPLVANIARKTLEYFAGFKWACRTTEDFTNIVWSHFIKDDNPFERSVGEFIIKFVHEYSHGQDFSRPITAAMFEAKKIADQTMEFIKIADKEHYNKLKSLANKSVESH